MYNYTIFCDKVCDNSNYIKKLFFNAKIKYNNINIQFLSQKEYNHFELKDYYEYPIIYYKSRYLGNFKDFIKSFDNL